MQKHQQVNYRALLRILFCLALPVSGWAQEVEKTDEEMLELKVILVSEFFDLKPIAKRSFLISSQTDEDFLIERVTDFEGGIREMLPQGIYTVTNRGEVVFEGKSFNWNVGFAIRPNSSTTVELSNDNAAIVPLPKTQASFAPEYFDAQAIYQMCKDSVFKVMAEGGHGSGFLVDYRGLVLTNHHVIEQSAYVAIKISESEKYEAIVIAEDSVNDLAVLRLNPTTVAHLTSLKLAEDSVEETLLVEGRRVFAIGSPFAADNIITSGIVSKIEEGVIYSDVAINEGNSGGPLLNSHGEVVGINTFGMGRNRGVSGIVRIYLAKNLMEQAVSRLNEAESPSNRRLKIPPDFRYPSGELRTKALETNLRKMIYRYHIEFGKLDVDFVTPVRIAALEVEDERLASNRRKMRMRRSKEKVGNFSVGGGFYEWRKFSGDFRPVVTIQVTPEIGFTDDTIIWVLLLGDRIPKKLKFRGDFQRMELYVDGNLIEPYHPGRIPEVRSYDEYMVSMHDVAFFGRYEYPPEAFNPLGKVELVVWREGKATPIKKELRKPMLEQIWDDFRPYLDFIYDYSLGGSPLDSLFGEK